MTVPADDPGLRVELESDASHHEVRAVQEALDEFGIPARAVPSLVPEPRGGPTEIPTLIQIAVAYGLLRFLDAFLAEAGKSAYQKLGHFIRSLRSRREGRPYQVRIIDQQAGLILLIRDDDPPEAFTALADVDLKALRPGWLNFYRDVGLWYWTPTD